MQISRMIRAPTFASQSLVCCHSVTKKDVIMGLRSFIPSKS